MIEFEIGDFEEIESKLAELTAFLTEVYVLGGYTPPEIASAMFAPQAVLARGTLIIARDTNSQALAGSIIMVPHDSPACKFAQAGEIEIHLLAVKQAYRGQHLGKRLVKEVIHRAQKSGQTKIILWTQTKMLVAQRLYESLGFERQSTFQIQDREFMLYHLQV